MDSLEKCPACEATITGNDKVCPDCGLNLSEDNSDFKESFCPVCRTFLKERVSECPSCHAEFNNEGNLVIHRIDDHLKEGEKRFYNFICQYEATKTLGEIVITNESFYFLGSNTSLLKIVLSKSLVFGIFFVVPAGFLGVTLQESAMYGIIPWAAIISIILKVSFSNMLRKKVNRIVDHLSMENMVFEAKKEDCRDCEMKGGTKFRLYKKSGLKPDFYEFGLSRYTRNYVEDRQNMINYINEWISTSD